MTWRTMAALARGDFLERTRRPGFLVTLIATLVVAYLFVPENHAPYTTLELSGHRGVYNSAWVGTLVAILANAFLSLVGFYLVKNALERDRRSGVGPVLAGTPITRMTYVLGKALSNVAVLGAIVGILILGSAAMQIVRAEDLRIAPIALVTPFLLITLPAMTLVAATAVFFEVVPGLRGGLGNVVYFFLWMGGLAQSELGSTRFDLMGLGMLKPSVAAAARRTFPEIGSGPISMGIGFNFKSSGNWDLTTFRWEGLRWTADAVAARGVWVGLALVLCAIAAALFDRFDAAPATSGSSRRPSSGKRPASPELQSSAAFREVHLTPLSGGLDLGPWRLLTAELALIRREVPWPGGLLAVGLIVASLLAPLPVVGRGILPALWILPLFLWSVLGNREARHGTEALLRSTPRPVLRPLLSQWGAGFALALALAIGVAVRRTMAGELVSLFGLIAGAAFVPALAVALGAWTRSATLFEVVYLLLWYMGPINRAAALDYTGATASWSSVLAWTLAALAGLAAAFAARRRG